jgi:MoxR-like ATPase
MFGRRSRPVLLTTVLRDRDQNPIEMEGTYALSEPAFARFPLKLRVRYPAIEELNGRTSNSSRARSSSRASSSRP